MNVKYAARRMQKMFGAKVIALLSETWRWSAEYSLISTSFGLVLKSL